MHATRDSRGGGVEAVECLGGGGRCGGVGGAAVEGGVGVEEACEGEECGGAAGAALLLALSRSVRQLRTALADGGVAAPLLQLLHDPCADVREAASAALCNLAVQFSPLQDALLAPPALAALAALAHCPAPHLRLNGLWALKNLTYQADVDAKRAVAQALGAAALLEALDEGQEHDVRLQAALLLRNLACDSAPLLLALLGADQVACQVARLLASPEPELARQGLFLASNLAADASHRDLLLTRPLLALVQAQLSAGEEAAQLAAWVLVNLTWTGDEGAGARAAALREAGVADAVRAAAARPLGPAAAQQLRACLGQLQL